MPNLEPTDEDLHLTANGWKKLRSGRWAHDRYNQGERQRPFTLEQALDVEPMTVEAEA